jgi:hypothetical protein
MLAASAAARDGALEKMRMPRPRSSRTTVGATIREK